MKIKCNIETTELEGDYGGMIPSIIATCTKCEHSTESYGTSEASIKRCLVLMREECPNGESNFYVGSEEYA